MVNISIYVIVMNLEVNKILELEKIEIIGIFYFVVVGIEILFVNMF